MTPLQVLTQSLSILIQTGRPGFVWGPPGIGKTSLIEACATALGRKFLALHASIYDSTDVSGIPVRAERDGMEFLRHVPMEDFMMLSQTREPYVLLLDEFSDVSRSMQSAMLRGVLERRFGSAHLGTNVSIILAGNEASVNITGNDLAAAMANRLVHLYMRVEGSEGDIIDGIEAGWPDPTVDWVQPSDLRVEIPKARKAVVQFLRRTGSRSGGNVHKMPKENSAEISRGWPSPRTWNDYVIPLMAASRAIGAPQETLMALMTGTLGMGAGTEFVTFLETQDLPGPQEVLDDPAMIQGMREDRVHKVLDAVLSAIDHGHISDSDEQAWGKAWRVIGTLRGDLRDGIAVPYAEKLLNLARMKDEHGAPKFSVPVTETDGLYDMLQARGL